MASFQVVVTDQRELAGITAAREQYNADNTHTAGFTALTTDAQYVQFVMGNAAKSYARALP